MDGIPEDDDALPFLGFGYVRNIGIQEPLQVHRIHVDIDAALAGSQRHDPRRPYDPRGRPRRGCRLGTVPRPAPAGCGPDRLGSHVRYETQGDEMAETASIPSTESPVAG